jgi:2,4-dienoyl-CoA reductase-like NADH-dependent reductase (Old Yellow Enzyme family)/thioredoxin reductase
MDFSKLLSPIKIGSLTCRNKVAFPPIDVKLAEDEENPINQAYVDFLDRLTKDQGTGLIISEFTAIKAGKLWVPAIRIDDDRYIGDVAKLAEGVHKNNSLFFLQIALLGGRTPFGRHIAPSAIESPYYLEVPEELTLSEIHELRQAWIDAAVRAKKAGCDGVELHGGHTYLLGEFISPHANRRTDEYGGDFKGRMRLPTELVHSIKEKLGPDFPVGIKISAYEIGENGITPPLSIDIAEYLEEQGVDYIHVSSSTYGVGGTKYPDVPSIYTDEGPLVPLAAAVKKRVQVPVIAVAGISSPDYAARVINNDEADIVAVGRAMFADPAWTAKVAAGRPGAVTPCIRCNFCHKKMIIDLAGGVECTVNPGLLDPPITKAASKQKIIVVGAGPAGLEAALTFDAQGHDVILYEKESELGGNVRLGCVPQFKKPLRDLLGFYRERLEASGVRFEPDTEITPEKAAVFTADHLVLAAGAKEYLPPIAGIDQPAVVKAKDFYRDRDRYSEGTGAVCVIGAGEVGCEISLFCARAGREVFCIDILPKNEWMADEHPTNRFTLLEQMDAQGVHILDDTTIREIGSGGTEVHCRQKEIEYIIHPELIVAATGYKGPAGPVKNLIEHKPENVGQVHVIGDSAETRDIHGAVHDGYRLARDFGA